MDDGTEPITDDELLYRRIPTSVPWYSASAGLSSQAFAPHAKNDITGLSVSRAKYKSIEAAAKGQPGKSYYVAILRAGALRQRGIQVVPHPLRTRHVFGDQPRQKNPSRTGSGTSPAVLAGSDSCFPITR